VKDPNLNEYSSGSITGTDAAQMQGRTLMAGMRTVVDACLLLNDQVYLILLRLNRSISGTKCAEVFF
jgi:hypothetical protein